MPASAEPAPVTIVGAGMAGAACAVALRSAGIAVQVLDRGRAPGGRMSSPLLHGRRVDQGAGYFTVRDEGFAAVLDSWVAAGAAHAWTDTFTVLSPDRSPSMTSGPMRWAASGGLRSLVRLLLEDVPVSTGQDLQSLPAGDVVLAMPDPQANRLVTVPDSVDYEPVITLACGFSDRNWAFREAAFVNDHDDVQFVADDGARRGDGAPVLVAHSTPGFARRHVDRPEDAMAPLIRALREILGIAQPEWASTHRWTYAKPSEAHPTSFHLSSSSGRLIGLAGDQWCPQGAPRVESAWRSGTDLAAAITALR